MNTTTLIILIEIVAVLSVLLLGLLFFNWKRKKKRHAELEQILNGVMEHEEIRKDELIVYLIDHQHIAQQQARELCEDFVEAEKQFMYAFLEQQIKLNSLDGFYENLRSLLDNYLRLLPEREAETPRAQSSPPPSHTEMKKEEVDWEQALADSDENQQ